MLKRIIRGMLMEAGALALLCLGLLISSSAASDTGTIAALAGIGGLVGWSLLSVLATLIGFDLIDA